MSSNLDYHVVVLGGGAVGKSAVTVAFIHSHFIERYEPTIEEEFRKQVTVDDEVAYLSILDTAGQEEFSVLRDQYMRSGEGFVLVYDITSLHSFDEISKIHEHIYRARDSIPEECHVPTVILGNKCDLEHLRQVSTFAGQEMAKNLKAKFFECSAKTRVNIDEAFYEIIREIRHARRPQMNDKKKEKPGKKIGGCIIL